MKDLKFLKMATLVGIAVIAFSGTVQASPLVFSLFDPDPQPANGTIATSALSERTAGGTTPVMNDYIGRGYSDITAYYDSDAKLVLPPLEAVPHDGKIYFHRNMLTPPGTTRVHVDYQKVRK